MSLRIPVLSVVWLLACPVVTRAQTVLTPVLTGVVENGKVVTVPIGQITVSPFSDPNRPELGARMTGKFEFRALGPRNKVRSILDHWYDFRWVNVVMSHRLDGKAVSNSHYGTLPAVVPGARRKSEPDPYRDRLPYFNTSAQWKQEKEPNHVELDFSRFIQTIREPNPTCPNPGKPCKVEVVVRSFLVAVARGAPTMADNEMCVITGFEWTYTQIFDSVTKAVRHITALGPFTGQIPPRTGASIIVAALNNDTGFTNPAGPWQVGTSCTLEYCAQTKKVGALPSKGIPEGWYVRAKERSGTLMGGLELVEPKLNGKVVAVTGLPDEMTGKGALTGFGVGIASVTPANAEGNLVYVGTKTRGSEGGKFEKYGLWMVEIDAAGKVVRATRVYESGTHKTPKRVGILDLDTAPEPAKPEREPRRAYYLEDSDDLEERLVSPIGTYDPKTNKDSRLPVIGTLPPGQATSIALDPTAQMLYITFPQPASTSTAVVTLPVEGGTPETIATVPAVVGDIAVDPRTGVVHALASPASYFQIDPVRRKLQKMNFSSRRPFFAVAFERGTGQIVMSNSTSMVRLDDQGRVTTLRAVSFGQVTAVAVVPSPTHYGTPTTGDFAADWDLPPRRQATASDNSPTPGNANFALTVSSGGWPLTGVIALAAKRTQEPGFVFGNLTLHVDPLSIFTLLPVVGGKTVAVPLPIPSGIGRVSVYGQGFFLDELGLEVASRGIRVTTID